jgi:mono/diheme cytochrome c family protein
VPRPDRPLLGLVLAALLALASQALAAGEAGRQHYILNCAGCHQFDGSGSRAHEIPNMRGAVGHFLRLPEGRAFLVQVPGTSNSKLTDAQIATMLNWLVEEFSRAEVPPDFKPYTPDEVKRLRQHPLDDVASTRGAIVARLAAMGYRIE